jgi:hypothetical protein
MTTKISGDIIRFFTKSVPKSTIEPEPELGAEQKNTPVDDEPPEYIYTKNGSWVIDNPKNYTPIITACSSGGNSGDSGTVSNSPSGGGGGGASLTKLSLVSVPNRFKKITVNITDAKVIISTKSTFSASAIPNMTITLNKGGISENGGNYASGGSGGVGDKLSTKYNGDSATIMPGTNGESVDTQYIPWAPPGGTAALNIGNYGNGADGVSPGMQNSTNTPGNTINNPYVHIVLDKNE